MENTSYPPYPQDHPQPAPGYPPPDYPPPPRAPGGGKGLAISAVAIGAVSILLCWVPVVNNVVFLTAPAAIGLAVPALVSASQTRSRTKALPIAGLILAVLSFAGAIGAQMLYAALQYSSLLDDVATSLEADPGAGAEGFDAKAEAASEPLALGSSAEIGEYSVTVAAVDTNATDAVLAMDPFNRAPQGRYVLVDVGVTYLGSEEGDPFLDLSTKFIGADARQYDDRTCSAHVPGEDLDVPTLEAGGVGEYRVCLDVPVEALADATIFVEESVFRGEDRVYWSVP